MFFRTEKEVPLSTPGDRAYVSQKNRKVILTGWESVEGDADSTI